MICELKDDTEADNEVEKWDIVEVELQIKYLSKFLLMVNQE